MSERALASLHNGLHKVFLAVPIRCQKVLFQVILRSKLPRLTLCVSVLGACIYV